MAKEVKDFFGELRFNDEEGTNKIKICLKNADKKLREDIIII